MRVVEGVRVWVCMAVRGCGRVRVYRCICVWSVGVVLCWCGCEYICMRV